jgi:hypothetical protein
MKRSIVIPIVSAAALTATAGEALATSATAGHKRLTVVVQDAQGSVTPADFIAAPYPQNTQAAEDAPVTQNGHRVGRSETVFTVTRADAQDPMVMIECSIELPHGIILFDGAFHPTDMFTGMVIPVVGGTGAYSSARGIAIAVAAHDGTHTTVTFDLTGD